MKRILSLFLVSLFLLGCAVPALAGQTAVELPSDVVARRIRAAADASDDALVTPDLLASITAIDLSACGLDDPKISQSEEQSDDGHLSASRLKTLEISRFGCQLDDGHHSLGGLNRS